MKETISFKSQEPFFSKEADGRKPNTIRKIMEDDPRWQILSKWMALDSYGQIEITSARGNSGFTRQVTDASNITHLMPETPGIPAKWAIISWKHDLIDNHKSLP